MKPIVLNMYCLETTIQTRSLITTIWLFVVRDTLVTKTIATD